MYVHVNEPNTRNTNFQHSAFETVIISSKINQLRVEIQYTVNESMCTLIRMFNEYSAIKLPFRSKFVGKFN